MAITLSAKNCISENGVDVDSMITLLSNRIDYNRYNQPLFSVIGFESATYNPGEYTADYMTIGATSDSKYNIHAQNILEVNSDGTLHLFDNFQYSMLLQYSLTSRLAKSDLAAMGQPLITTYTRLGRFKNNAWDNYVTAGREFIYVPTYVDVSQSWTMETSKLYWFNFADTKDPIALQVYFDQAAYMYQHIERAKALVIAIPMELE